MDALLLIVIFNSINGYLCPPSVEKVKTFYDADENVVESLYQHLSVINDYVAVIQEYATEHHRMANGLDGEGVDDDILIKNPLYSFQIIRRIAKNRRRIAEYIYTMAQEFVNQIDYAPYGNESTLQRELNEAAEGILRLQNVYQLHPIDLQQGKIEHVNSSLHLTVEDCVILATMAKFTNRMDFYLEWIELANRICNDGISSAGYTCAHTKSFYENAKSEHDAMWLKKQEANEIPHINFYNGSIILLPNLTSLTEPLTQRSQLIKEQICANRDTETLLCKKGETLMNASETSKLKCYYLYRESDVYATLQHYKIEEQSIYPLVFTIHDVISLAEVELLKELSKPKFQRSLVGDGRTGDEFNPGSSRVSETGWLDDNNPSIYKMSKRVESITGLKVTCPNCSEAFQVVNYGIGGLYKAHYDSHNWKFYWPAPLNVSESNDKRKDDRYATFIIYLNEVELGGTTVFPYPRISITPKTAVATFFYNLDEYGDVIEGTLHGGCPVLYGSKWIANKWIMYNAQMFIRKCPLHPKH